MTIDGGHLIPILARAELLNLRSYLRLGPRDAIFVIAMAAIVLFAFAALHEGVATVEAMPGIKPWAAFGWGILLVTWAWLKPHSGAVARLQGGIFHPWATFGNGLRLWSCVRAIAISAALIVVTAVVVALVRLPDTLPFVALSAAGAVIGALACYHLYAYSGNVPAPPRAKRKLPELKLRWPTTPAWTILTQRLRRRIGFMPAGLAALLLIALGTVIGGLAAINNQSPGAGFTIVSATALISGSILTFPDLALVRLAARQPVSLRRLLALFSLLPLGLVVIATLIASLTAGLGLVLALSSAAFVACVLAVWLLLLLPQAMMRSPRGAIGLAAGDLVMALIIKAFALFGLLAVLYLVIRIVFNLRSTTLGRWRPATLSSMATT